MKIKNLYIDIGINTFYQFSSRVVSSGVALIVTRYLATAIGLTGYGQYQIVAAYVTFFWVFTDLGLTTISVREAGKHKTKFQEYFSNLLSIRLILGILLTILANLVVLFFPYSAELKLAIFFASITILFQSLFGAGMFVVQIQSKYVYYFIANTLSGLALLLGFFFVISYKGSVIGLALVLALSNLILFGFQALLIRNHVDLKLAWVEKLITKLVKKSLSYGISLIFNLTVYKQDAILLSLLSLKNISNESAVGIYSLSYKIFELGIVLPGYLVNVMFPKLNLQFQEKNYVQFRRSFFRTLGILALSGTITTLVIFLLSSFLVDFVSGNQAFVDSKSVLRILSLAIPSSFLLPLLVHTQIIFDKQSRLVYIFAFAWFLNLVLNLTFIPNDSYFAAASTTVITEWFLMLLLLVVSIFSLPKNENES